MTLSNPSLIADVFPALRTSSAGKVIVLDQELIDEMDQENERME